MIKQRSPRVRLNGQFPQQEQRRSVGRPTVYKPEYAQIAGRACANGLTDQEISDLFGITRDTLWRWKLNYLEFSDAMKIGKVPANERVKRSLFHRANGYTYDAEEIYVIDKEIVRVKVRKHIPPDTTAIIYWLGNRCRGEWKSVNRTELTGRDGAPIDIKAISMSMSPMEAAEMYAATLKAPDNLKAIEHKPKTEDEKED